MPDLLKAPLLLVAFALLSVVVTAAAAGLALQRPSMSHLTLETRSRLVPDYSADPLAQRLAPLNPDVIRAAAEDEAGLTQSSSINDRLEPLPAATQSPAQLEPTTSATPGRTPTASPTVDSTASPTSTAQPTATRPPGTPTPGPSPTVTPVPTASPVPTPTPDSLLCVLPLLCTPTPTNTPTPTATPTPTPTSTPTPTNTPQPTPTPDDGLCLLIICLGGGDGD